MEDGKKTTQKSLAGWADHRVADWLSRVKSPGLPRGLGLDPLDADYYLFEYLEGETLRQLPQGELTSSNLQRWFDQVLDALALLSLFAGLPFAHLDLSPENIVITGQGRACPIDFASSRFLDGKADLPDTSRTMTAGYAAPEIYYGQLCPEADLYSLAMSMLATCAGKVAAELEGPTTKRILKQLDRSLAERLRACLSEDPAQRRRAVGESLYGLALQTDFKQAEVPEDKQAGSLDKPPLTGAASQKTDCPFPLTECPFLELAHQFEDFNRESHGSGSMPAACYNKPEQS